MASPEPLTQLKLHEWHIMSHAPVEILGLDSEGQPAVFRTDDAVEGVACMHCATRLAVDLSNAREECKGEDDGSTS